jgi:hypothetical protein
MEKKDNIETTQSRLDAVVERLKKSFQSCYDIYDLEEAAAPAVVRCEYYESFGHHVISKKAEVWSANGEEFLYLIKVDHLTAEIFESVRTRIYEDGMTRLHVGPGHMCSYITPVFLCESCDEDARRALKKTRIYKSFRFSLHGWMDFRVCVVEMGTGRIDCNRAGKSTAKNLKHILKDLLIR